MKKLYAILASAVFSVELVVIEYVLPTNFKLLISGTVFIILFYLTLRAVGLLDDNKQPTKPEWKKTKKKTKTPPKEPKSEPKKDEKKEEESDFMKEWKNLEEKAK